MPIGYADKHVPLQRRLKHGRIGEILIADQLRKMGWWILPIYDSGGSPPLMLGRNNDALIVPDILATKRGKKPVWVEVKTYLDAPMFRAHGFKTHGVKQHQYADYMKVSALTRLPIFLAVVELDTMRMLMANLRTIEAYACQCEECKERGKTARNCEVYFNRADFCGFGEFSRKQLEAAAKKSGVQL